MTIKNKQGLHLCGAANFIGLSASKGKGGVADFLAEVLYIKNVVFTFQREA